MSRKSKAKPVDRLTINDLKRHPIWEFDLDSENDPERDETWVAPVAYLPVSNLDNRVVGTQVILADASVHWALLGNVNLSSRESTEQFLSITVFNESRRFHLARYFDVDFETRGAVQLAQFLGRSIESIFPIRWDLAKIAADESKCKSGLIFPIPPHPLSEEQRMKLIFSS